MFNIQECSFNLDIERWSSPSSGAMHMSLFLRIKNAIRTQRKTTLEFRDNKWFDARYLRCKNIDLYL